ncbi:MAG: thermonuclease family protein [Pseudomonadota bacterium]
MQKEFFDRRRMLLALSAMSVCSNCAGRSIIEATQKPETPDHITADELSSAVAVSGTEFKTEMNEFTIADVISEPVTTRIGREAQISLQNHLDTGSKEIEMIDTDRWGRIVCRVNDVNFSKPVAHSLLEAGLLRVLPTTEDFDAIKTLLKIENDARNKRRGLWAAKKFRIYNASQAVPFHDVHLVEGNVKSVAIKKGRLFINFGEDFRTDTTFTAPAGRIKNWIRNPDTAPNELWASIAQNEKQLVGKTIRGRGYISRINGPSIEIQHPLQIELVPSAAPIAANG